MSLEVVGLFVLSLSCRVDCIFLYSICSVDHLSFIRLAVVYSARGSFK